MEDVEFENSLLMLTHASLLKRKIPESSEPTTPPSSARDGDESPHADGDDAKNKRKKLGKNKPKASVSVDQTDINVTVSYSTLPRDRPTRRVPINDGSSSGSEETSDASPVRTTPAALVAKLDPNLPLLATLDRNMLLSMSSKDFETFFAHLSTERTLTRSEEKMLKAQRRLISNRESAQASRRRKKAYIEELEGRVLEMSFKMSQVAANNAALSAQTAELISENATLKTRLDELSKGGASTTATATSQNGPTVVPPP